MSIDDNSPEDYAEQSPDTNLGTSRTNGFVLVFLGLVFVALAIGVVYLFGDRDAVEEHGLIGSILNGFRDPLSAGFLVLTIAIGALGLVAVLKGCLAFRSN